MAVAMAIWIPHCRPLALSCHTTHCSEISGSVHLTSSLFYAHICLQYGAVRIYRGALLARRFFGTIDAAGEDFCRRHLAAEEVHLAAMENLVPVAHRTRLLPVWHVMAYTTGFLPALCGNRALYWTIAAVESYVETHYVQQIKRMTELRLQPLRESLQSFCDDEVGHKNEAVRALLGLQQDPNTIRPSMLPAVWMYVVDKGSKLAVCVSRLL